MKPTSVFTALSFLLWLSLTTTKPSLASASEEVLDVTGEPLVPGKPYYVVSAIWGAGGGGVAPRKTEDSLCAYSVIQHGRDFLLGDPVNFTIPGSSSDLIYEGSTKLKIAFVDKPKCAESSTWVVASESGSSLSSSRLVIGGSKDFPNSILVSGVFKIKKLGFGYKLVFVSSGSTYTVGRDEKRQLIVEDSDEAPFWVVFKKANSDDNKKPVIRKKAGLPEYV